MQYPDPYEPGASVYECRECGNRETTDGHRGSCANCGGPVWNIGVPRE